MLYTQFETPCTKYTALVFTITLHSLLGLACSSDWCALQCMPFACIYCTSMLCSHTAHDKNDTGMARYGVESNVTYLGKHLARIIKATHMQGTPMAMQRRCTYIALHDMWGHVHGTYVAVYTRTATFILQWLYNYYSL